MAPPLTDNEDELRLPAKSKALLDKLSKLNKQPPKQLVHQALKEYIRILESASATDSAVADRFKERVASNGAEKTPYEIAQEIGVIGAVDFGPGDLATNPKHMEDFGKDN